MLLHPKEETTLLRFLQQELPDWRPRTIKERLKRGCVSVNGAIITHHLSCLVPGDEVRVSKQGATPARPKAGIRILHQDASVIGIEKPAGLLSVGTDRVRTQHAMALLRSSLGVSERLWPVHRLDRETSGVLLFARSRADCDAIQERWSEVEKRYFAVVQGCPEPGSGLIDQPLYEHKNLHVSVRAHPSARDARTRFWTRKKGSERSLLELELETGRRHQIRAHLAWLGHPVVGDERYGVRAERMALHAHQLVFVHPVTGRELRLESPVPQSFSRLLGRRSAGAGT